MKGGRKTAASPDPGSPGKGTYAARAREPAAVVLASDLLRWVIPAVAKFPRNLRYGLGARIEGALTDVLEELVVAQYARGNDRVRALERGNQRLQVARHLLRMAVEVGCLSQRQGVFVARLTVSLGGQVGAWRKASAGMGNSSQGSANRGTC